MREVTALFWDIGGVVLSNGWDTADRDEAARRFHFDRQDFERRHEIAFPEFEAGRITLDAYLEQTVFFSARAFTRDEFKAFLFACSTENTATRALLDEVTATRGFFLAALNNEGREVNAYRIRTFNLKRNFAAFLSSCYLGVRKPDEIMYRMALDITQRAPAESLFIDDRPANVEAARRVGMNAIHYQNPEQLRAEMEGYAIPLAGTQGEKKQWNLA